MSESSYGKKYSWSEQCKSLIEKMFKLVVDGMLLHLDSTSLFIKNYADFEDK